MRSRWILLAATLAFSACRAAPAPDQPARPDSVCLARADSLQHALDSVATAYSQLRVRARFAELSAKRYAGIVARNPSQAVFLKGWMNRAFEGMLPDSTP